MDKFAGFLQSEFEKAVVAHSDSGASGKAVPIPETVHGQAALRERERRFRCLLDALPAAIYTTDTTGHITYYNERAVQLWGRRPQLGAGHWCGSWKLYWPDGTPMAHSECPMAMAVKEGRPVRGIEATAERPDGTRVPILPYPTPLYDETGMMVGAVNMLVDISERKRAEDEQALLVRELHHRVKNTLATVQAIMGATARSAGSIEQFKDAMIGRINSLARTHLLLSDDGGSATFADIVRKELNAFDDGSGERVRLSGPAVDLPSQLAVSLGMALHELATNAAKHGSLSVPTGAVAVTWSVADSKDALTLEIDWVEGGGPLVSEPARHGFGSRLLNFVLPGQISARTHVEYIPDGLHVHCAVPLSRNSGTQSRKHQQ